MHCSEGVLVDETANTWVGNKRDDGDDERTGTDNAPGRWLFGRIEGRWEGARADIPASILCIDVRDKKKGVSATADVLWCFRAKASPDVLGRNTSEIGRHGLDCAGRDFGVVGAGQSRRELDGAAVVTRTGGSVTRLLGQHAKRSRVRRDLEHYFKSGGREARMGEGRGGCKER